MWDPYAQFEKRVLDNGLTVYSSMWPRAWETVGFVVHSGAKHDPDVQEGLAHFVEHLLIENAPMTSLEASDFFSDCGGSFDFGQTNYICTTYCFTVPLDSENIRKALSLFASMLLSAKLEKGIEKERQAIFDEFNRRLPTQLDINEKKHRHEVLYQGHYLRRSLRPLGWPETVSRIQQEDLQAFYDSHYTPANISVVGVGGLTVSELTDLLDQCGFSQTKPGQRSPLLPQEAGVILPLEKYHEFRLSDHMKGGRTSSGYETVAKFPGTTEPMLLKLIKKMLHHVLFQEIRKKRSWAYGVDCGYRNYFQFWEFGIGIQSLAAEAISSIADVVDGCISSLSDRDDLFEQMKKRALNGHLTLDCNGQGIRNGAMDDLAYHHRIITISDVHHRLEQLTMDNVRDALHHFQPERRWTLMIFP